MAGSNYIVRARKDIDGSPLLIVTFNVEYEVLLNKDRFEDLHKSVVRYADGVSGEKLATEEFQFWDVELKRLGGLRNSLGELPAYALMNIETKQNPIPRGLLHQILTDFEANTSKNINVFVTGHVVAPATQDTRTPLA
ncbi:hypothetical protein [Caballeronia sp. AZ10_KS36]|uniref:hypothetical protein n=1 Tax=Caballeronia sp. AZ10_KS36 TaxID=2921757 RepID=UPI00202966A5|nr:hypothetical protein [Caballeronia sp. AZ10_KS36]